MPRIVISDATPIHYLALIAEAELLPLLYGEVLIPEAVALELQQPRTPELVRRWIQNPPAWLQIVSLATLPALAPEIDLDKGEQDTLGILDQAAERGLIDLGLTFARLRQTNFHINPALLERLLAARPNEKGSRFYWLFAPD